VVVVERPVYERRYVPARPLPGLSVILSGRW
jgi:hypothetical protein